MRVRSTVYHFLVYHLTFALFGLGGFLLSVLCLLVCWLPDTPAMQRRFRRLIHRLFVVWLAWHRLNGIFRITFTGFERLPRDTGLVLVANHPGLMDATYLLGRLPEVVCLFKPQIRNNPLMGAAARRAGYLPSDGGVDTIRRAAQVAAEGHILLIFPEGTRTRQGEGLNPLKPGFALIAQRAKVPVQLVSITCDSALATKDHPWWILPRFPANIHLTLGPLLHPSASARIESTVEEARQWLAEHSLPVPP